MWPRLSSLVSATELSSCSVRTTMLSPPLKFFIIRHRLFHWLASGGLDVLLRGKQAFILFKECNDG
eukprot:m.153023 g.153023  ORF g.153023 m.153023 type:complete len:66 (+) comp52853_c0_seq2:238-435(+)